MPFEFKKLDIDGLVLVKPKVFDDSRGFFFEAYKKSEFFSNGITTNFVQDNHSKSTKGVLRGLHFQIPPHAQAKLVSCIKGKIFDVAVDLRKNSPTFKKWAGVTLSEQNKNSFFIPEGFAHGFVVLSDEAEITYKVSSEYSTAADRGLRWNDPDINIDWNIDFNPLLSNKDSIQPFFREIEDLL